MLMLQGWNSPRPERDGNVGCIPLGSLTFDGWGSLSKTNWVMGMCVNNVTDQGKSWRLGPEAAISGLGEGGK